MVSDPYEKWMQQKEAMSLTEDEYADYLQILADVEGGDAVVEEAQRQRDVCRDLERRLHEVDARLKKREALADLRRKEIVLTGLLADVMTQEKEILGRQRKILESVFALPVEDRHYCPCDSYCYYVHEARQKLDDPDPF